MEIKDYTLLEIENRLESQLDSVNELANFDKKITDVCLDHLELLNSRFKAAPFDTTNQMYLCEGTINAIKTIRINDSLRNHYDVMHNQCIVLSVSFFTSAISDIFKYSVQKSAEQGTLPSSKEDIKLSIEELKKYDFNLIKHIAEIILQRKDISFQDMQSIVRSFRDYLDIEINRDQKCNDIIFAQASRHSIIHANSIADGKFINQIKGAEPRNIKLKISVDETIKYTSSEIEFVKFAMLVFVQELRDQITTKLEIS